MRPGIPTWLEEMGEKLACDDSRLTTLELTHQRIDDAQARFLAEKLKANTSVETLLLSCYNIVDEGSLAIGEALEMNRGNIRRLQLRDLRDPRGSRIFFNAIRSLQALQEFSLRNCLLDSNSTKHLDDCVSNHIHLVELRIVDSQFQGSGLCQLRRGFQGCSSLRRLYLINVGVKGGEMGKFIGSLLSQNTGLEELYVGENTLGDEGTLEIAQKLTQNVQLKVLDLRSNGIGYKGASLLATSLRKASISELKLNRNRIQDAGAATLAEGLLESRLKRLDISNNQIGTNGAKSLSKMLECNTNLQDLNLSFNGLGDTGAEYVSSVLVKNKSLRSLSLRSVQMTDVGAAAFATRLPSMSLQTLIISRNKISKSEIDSLLCGLRQNMELEKLVVEEKWNHDSSLREIVHWTRLNRAGRKIFRDDSLPLSLWAEVFSTFNINVDLNVMYHFISHKPEAFQFAVDRVAFKADNYNGYDK